MPKTSKPAQKYPSFTMRLSEEELARLKNKAGEAKLTPAAFVRNLIAGREVKSGKDLVLLDAINRSLSPIGNNLNQIARHANRYRADANVEGMLKHLSNVQEDLGKLLRLIEKQRR